MVRIGPGLESTAGQGAVPVLGEPDQQLFVYSTQPASASNDALRILASCRTDQTDAAALESFR